MLTLSKAGANGFFIICEQPTDEEMERLQKFFGCQFNDFMNGDTMNLTIADIQNCQNLALPEIPDEPVLTTERIKRFAKCFGKPELGETESPFSDVFVFSPTVTSAITGEPQSIIEERRKLEAKRAKQKAKEKESDSAAPPAAKPVSQSVPKQPQSSQSGNQPKKKFRYTYQPKKVSGGDGLAEDALGEIAELMK